MLAIVSVTGLASDKLGGCSYSCLFLFRLIMGVLPISYVLDYMCIVLSWLIEIMGIDCLEFLVFCALILSAIRDFSYVCLI